ncbi:MAG: hypothetical protein HY582_00420 [Candidatus Omnitrophica bacterium]|nr:hypothetical protein [Candidatus Omnitrophota bacterium]
MPLKHACVWVSFFFVLLSLFLLPIPAYAGERVAEGRNFSGQKTETWRLDNGGTEVRTFDKQTGIEVSSERFVGTELLPSSVSYVNLETGERRVVTYKDRHNPSKGYTEHKFIDSTILGQIRRRKQAEESQRELDRIKEQIERGESTMPRLQLPKKEPDEWDFLPDYKPGMILKDKESDSEGNSQEMEETVPDQIQPAAGDAPITPTTTIQDEAPNLPSSPFEGVKEREYKEIDYHKYGDILGYDPQRGVMSAIKTATGAATEFVSTSVLFGEMYGGIVAQTKMNGKIVNEDYYNRYGDLVKSVSMAPNGVQTTTEFNRDGSQTVMKTDSNGKPIENRATSTDPKTGITTTSVEYPNGTRKVTQTDKDGKIISETVLDRDNHVIRDRKSEAPIRKVSQAPTSAGDLFSESDAVQAGVSGRFAATAAAVTTAALNEVHAGDLAFGTGADPSSVASSKTDYE